MELLGALLLSMAVFFAGRLLLKGFREGLRGNAPSSEDETKPSTLDARDYLLLHTLENLTLQDAANTLAPSPDAGSSSADCADSSPCDCSSQSTPDCGCATDTVNFSYDAGNCGVDSGGYMSDSN